MSAYSSSNLDDPRPAWTPYNPKNGIAWAPRVVHVYQDNDSDSDSEKPPTSLQQPRGKAPLRRRSSLLNLPSGISSVFGSVTNVLTPGLSRKNSTGTNEVKMTSTPKLRPRTMSDSAFARQSPLSSSSLRNRNSVEGTMFGSRTYRISESRESLPSVNSDGAKSSMESAEDASFRAVEMSDCLSGSSPEGSPASRSFYSNEPCFVDSHQERLTPELQKLVPYDIREVFVDRRLLKTGRLISNEGSCAVCCGSLRTKNPAYPCLTKAATVHIYKGLTSQELQIQHIKNVASMRRLRHRHVAHVFGLCVERSSLSPEGVEVMVVTERAHFHLNLRRLVLWAEENNEQLLTPELISTFGLQICQGLRFLENRKIIHTNLTTATILVDSQCVCKLFDFDFQPLEDRRLNTRWLPLETFLQSMYIFKSVVWTFGIVLWEMASFCLLPYSHLSTLNDIILYLAHGKRLIRPDNCPKGLYRIMCLCWKEKTRNRPSFDELITLLTSYRQTLPHGKSPEEAFPDRDDFWEDNSWMDGLDGVYDITMM